MALYVSEMAHDLKKQGKTLSDYSDELDSIYGIFREEQVSHELKEGQKGEDFVETEVLKASISTLANRKVLQKGVHPEMGIVVIELDSLQILVRPSGTEPKVKFYLKLGPFKGTIAEAKEYLSSVATAIKKLFSK